MHDDLLGCRLHACGGALFELSEQGHWGARVGPWQRCLDAKLARAWDEFTKWLSQRGLSTSTSKFSSRVISMHRRVDWPCLKAKAANAAMVCDWIADIAIAVAEHEPNERNRARAVMLWGFKELWRIFRLGHWLTEEEAAAVEKARMCALLGYHACSK